MKTGENVFACVCVSAWVIVSRYSIDKKVSRQIKFLLTNFIGIAASSVFEVFVNGSIR